MTRSKNATKKVIYTDEFIKDIPKSDLHLHLDGSLRLNSLIEMAQKDGVGLPSYTPEGLGELVFKETYNDLGEYLHGFMYTCAVLRNPENLERCAYELAIDNMNEGVRYIEVRFAPQLLMDGEDLTKEVVLKAVNDGLKRAQQEFNQRKEVQSLEEPGFYYGIIVCAMRFFGAKSFSPYYSRFYSLHRYSDPISVIKLGALELAKAAVHIRDTMGIPIVGFDLAGQEAGYPAEDFIQSYDYIHKNFMHKTVHAGEAYGAESIFQAITDLHADRVGHGYYLFDTEKIEEPSIKDKKKYVDNLASYIADKRITIEVCLTSNLQTNPKLKSLKDHSFKEMLQRRVAATFCTDNRLVSNTTVSKEWRLALDHFEFTQNTIKDYIAYGFKKNFFPGNYVEKRQYARSIMKYYDKVAKKHGLSLK